MKESDWNSTLARINAISPDAVCAMKKEAFRVYHKHFATHAGQLETFMSIIDARKVNKDETPAFDMPVDWNKVCSDEDENGNTPTGKCNCFN
jgi:hypothetical protein